MSGLTRTHSVATAKGRLAAVGFAWEAKLPTPQTKFLG